MTNNIIVLQKDDLKEIVSELFGELCAKCGINEKPSPEEGEWLTRDEVCDMLHITPTTLWRKEKEGVIRKYKMGRRNLYSKREVCALFSSLANATDKNVK